MGDATATATHAKNADTSAEVILGVPSVTGKGVDRSAARTRRIAQFFFPPRFQFGKAIVVVTDVDEYNCIWCEGVGVRLRNQEPALSSPFSQSLDTVNRQYSFISQIRVRASTLAPPAMMLRLIQLFCINDESLKFGQKAICHSDPLRRMLFSIILSFPP